MSRDRLTQIKALEGHQVSLSLRDGSRLDDCQLVSTGRNQVSTLWLFGRGTDTFIPLDQVIDLWESRVA
jgi:hypothetical protein